MGAGILMEREEFSRQYKLAQNDVSLLMRSWAEREAEPVVTLTVVLVALISTAYGYFEDEEVCEHFLRNVSKKGKDLYEEIEKDTPYVH